MSFLSSIGKTLSNTLKGSSGGSKGSSYGSKGSSYTPSSDIKADMNRYLANGGKTTDATYQSMVSARNDKIMGTDWQSKINSTDSQAQKDAYNSIRNEKLGLMGGGQSGNATPSWLQTNITEQPTEATEYYENYLTEQQNSLKQAQAEAERAAQLRTQQAIEANNAYIPQVDQQSDKQLQNAYIAAQQAKINAPQSLAALGYTGGATESSLLGLDASYQNQRGAIEQGRNDSLDKIRQNAQTIQASGNADLASLGAQYYNNLVSAQQQAAQQAQSQSNWQSEFDLQKQNSDKEDFLNSMGAYYSDYQAQINKVQGDGDPSNDWQIAYLQQAKLKKQQELMNTDEQNDPSYATALQAYNKGIRTEQVLRVLGLA